MAGLPPTVAEFKAWLRVDPADMIDDVAIGEGLAAAEHQQTLLLNMPAGWTADLHLACMLRCARYLARRNSPEGLVGFADFGPARITAVDRDVTALEAPYVKVLVG